MSRLTIKMLQNYFNYVKLIVDKIKVSFSLSTSLRYIGAVAVYFHSSATSALDKGEWLTSRPGRIPRRKNPNTIWMWCLLEPSWALLEKGINFFLLPGFESRTVQPAASNYTDYANLAGILLIFLGNNPKAINRRACRPNDFNNTHMDDDIQYNSYIEHLFLTWI